jgi:hypothetical protein
MKSEICPRITRKNANKSRTLYRAAARDLAMPTAFANERQKLELFIGAFDDPPAVSANELPKPLSTATLAL